MDYDFQQHSEHRGFRFADEDEPKRKKSSKPKTKTDYLIRLILLQCLLSALIVSGFFIASKVSPSSFERMKADYTELMNNDMSAGEIVEQIKSAAEYVFTPGGSAVASSDNITIESFEVTSDETGETVAVGEISEGLGGGDIESKEAAQGTSFAPYFVSVEPVMPVENARVTSRFGYRTNPVSGKYGFHTGIDLATDEGTPVSASFYGKIIETGSSDVWGNYVLMEHSDGLRTYYCHLSEIYAEENSLIRQGETIGTVGSTGWSTGPHLHFEVRINGVRVNPENILYPDEA